MAYSSGTQINPGDSTSLMKSKHNVLAELVGDVSVLDTLVTTSIVDAINSIQTQINNIVTGQFNLINDEYLLADANGGGTVSIIKANSDNKLEFGTDVVSINIDGGTITSLSAPLAVEDGGTGATTASGARTSLGLAIGTDVQSWDTNLDQIAALSPTLDNVMVGDGSAWVLKTPSELREILSLVPGTDIQAWDEHLDQISALSPNSDNFILGDGSSWVTASPSQVRTAIGLVIGTTVQAWSTTLDQISAMSPTTDNFIMGNGSAWQKVTAEQARVALGLAEVVAPGIVTEFAGDIAPNGWLMCDGSAVSRTTYAALFNVIGTKYGAGNGTTTFNLPSAAGKHPIGKNASVTALNDLGKSGGSFDHTHTIPAHYHGMGAGATLSTTNSGAHSVNIDHSHTASIGSTNITLSDFGHSHGVSDPGHSHGVSDPGHVHPVDGGTKGSGNTSGNAAAWASSSGGQFGVFSGIADLDKFSYSGTTNISIVGSGTGIGIFGSTSNIVLNNGNHSHSVSVNSTSGLTANIQNHTHPITGLIGLVTGGQNGNLSMTSGSSNAPYLVFNYIIKT